MVSTLTDYRDLKLDKFFTKVGLDHRPILKTCLDGLLQLVALTLLGGKTRQLTGSLHHHTSYDGGVGGGVVFI